MLLCFSVSWCVCWSLLHYLCSGAFLALARQYWRGGVKKQTWQQHECEDAVACLSYGCIWDLAYFFSYSQHLESSCAHSRCLRNEFFFFLSEELDSNLNRINKVLVWGLVWILGLLWTCHGKVSSD